VSKKQMALKPIIHHEAGIGTKLLSVPAARIVFMASHSAQGPQLGIPQMIQSRAQFGVIGAILPLFLVMFIYLGFFASSTILAAGTLICGIPS
jgi:purine-cytosine permease-like protein